MAPIPIFYINRESRDDRRKLIESQFAALGLTGERVRATEADEVPAGIRDRYCDPRRTIFLSPGAAACTTSHLRLWQRLLAGNVRWALILEDDAVLSPLLPDFLKDFAGEGFDLVRLETILRQARILPEAGRVGAVALHPFRSVTVGSAAYLISHRAMQLLSAPEREAQLFDRALDVVLFQQFAEPARSLRIAMTDPGLAVQLYRAESTPRATGDIAGKGPRQVSTRWLRGKRQLWRAWLGLASGVDHLRHLPRGVTRRMIRFAGDMAAHRESD